LVELMIAAAIVGVLALIGTPMLKGMMPAVRVNAAARELATEMQSARMRAVTKRTKYQVAFDTTNHTFTLCADQNADGSITCTAGDPDVVKTVAMQEKYQQTVVFGYASGAVGPPGSSSPAPITSAVTFDDDYASFKPFGTAKPGTVYLIPSADLATGRKDRIRAITVVSSTGRVKLWKCNASCNMAGSWSAS
jgi:Tfp pilus assembly protein FimT